MDSPRRKGTRGRGGKARGIEGWKPKVENTGGRNWIMLQLIKERRWGEKIKKRKRKNEPHLKGTGAERLTK